MYLKDHKCPKHHHPVPQTDQKSVHHVSVHLNLQIQANHQPVPCQVNLISLINLHQSPQPSILCQHLVYHRYPNHQQPVFPLPKHPQFHILPPLHSKHLPQTGQKNVHLVRAHLNPKFQEKHQPVPQVPLLPLLLRKIVLQVFQVTLTHLMVLALLTIPHVAHQVIQHFQTHLVHRWCSLTPKIQAFLDITPFPFFTNLEFIMFFFCSR